MPTLQVLQREPDNSIQNMQKATDSFIDNIHKAQALKQTAEYYKIMSKNAETTAKKYEFDKKVQGMEAMAKGMTMPAELRPAYYKSLFKAGIVDMGMIGDSQPDIDEFYKTISAPTKMEEAEIGKQEAEASLKQNTADLLKNGGFSALPPGTTITDGKISMPVNPRLTDTEQAAVSGFEKFEPIVQNIERLINEGVLDSGKNRAFTQLLADSGSNPLSRFAVKDDSPLEELSSGLAELKKYVFSEGGKALTEHESKIVNTGLTLSGKGNAQAIKDLKEAISILRKKSELAIGGSAAAKFKNNSPGANAVRELNKSGIINQNQQFNNPFDKMSDEEIAQRINELQGRQ